MSVLAALFGVGLIFFALREVFQQLFVPNGSGSLSRVLMRGVWRAFRRVAVRQPASLLLAGPCTFLVVIASWSALLVVGWVLVYLVPHAGRVPVRSWPRRLGPERVFGSPLPLAGDAGDLRIR